MTADRDATDRYWRQLRPRSLVVLLLAIFFTFATLGFVVDLMDGVRRTLPAVLFLAAYCGCSAAAFSLVLFRRRRWILPVVVAYSVGTLLIARLLPPPGASITSAAGLTRLMIDGIGLLAAVIGGYVLLMVFIQTEGTRYVRWQTEMRLARGMQEALVPDIEKRFGDIEACGRSEPGAEVGGDLIDAFETPSGSVFCLADVSGHGVAAGLMTGTVKTALRAAFRREASMSAAVSAVDTVLPDVKPASMYATLAAVWVRPDGTAEYCLAGHMPVLHWRAADSEVHRLSGANLPLGLVPGRPVETAAFVWEQDDVIAIVSDGLTEASSKSGEEYGLDRIADLLTRHAREPLASLRDRIFAEARAWGAQEDDQSVLLFRSAAR